MVAADYQRIILKTGGINDELSKMRNVDAGRDLPGVRIPDQPCQEKEKTSRYVPELPSVGSCILKKPHRIMREHLCDPVEYICSVCVAASEEP